MLELIKKVLHKYSPFTILPFRTSEKETQRETDEINQTVERQ